jgi:4-hydroxybenzoate polyprenyltransferase
MFERLWIYQRERFPLGALGTLSILIAAAATMFSALARKAAMPGTNMVLAAAASALLIFVQMRVLDEFKDFEDDSRFRPYRPVPRGLVTLLELRWVLAVASAGLVAIAIAVDARMLWLLAALWAYLYLMTREFFVREWLRPRAFAYLASHNPFGALVVLYATAFEWLPQGQDPHPALAFLTLAAFFDTALLEISRKIRAPQDEETGVVTYSAIWGRTGATGAWLGAFGLMAFSGWFAARETGHGGEFATLIAPIGIAGAIACWRYLRNPETHRAKALEALSGIATLALYAALGPIPVLLDS